jgi:hypothetical protein
MEATREHKIRVLYERVLSLPAESREAFLWQTCPDDPMLIQDVLKLLRTTAPEQPQPVDSSSVPTTPAVPEATRGAGWIGPYRVERLLGRGGMGEVWQAVRDDGTFRKVVAIKIMTTPLEGEGQFLQRFRQERQMLANLDHPGISRILDGGELSDGRPYMVMDFIDGLPLDRHCDERRLSIEDRVRLVIQVCEAVDYLHKSGIIHRDLKPGNVLVTPNGTVKLLDFGIARVSSVAVADPLMTAPQHRLLTPGYASPEQMAGETCTPRSDIYSLGAVLYRLLTQQTPSLSAPTAPSGMISATEMGQAKTARKLPSHMLGDLDGIAMKALEHNPAHRYATALELAEDLKRFLEGRPVTARAAPAGERIMRFARRRSGVLAVAAVVLALAVFGGVQTYRYLRAQDSAEAERRQLAALLERLPAAPASASMTASESDKLLAEVKQLRLGLESMAHATSATAAESERRGAATRQVVDFLDRTAPAALKSPALAAEIGRTYQAAADLKSKSAAGAKPEVLDLYSKASYLLRTGQSSGVRDADVSGRIIAVAKRVMEMGGNPAVLDSSLREKWTAAPASQTAEAEREAQPAQPVPSTSPPAQRRPGSAPEAPPALAEKAATAPPPAAQQTPPPSAPPPQAPPAARAPAGWQERLTNISIKVSTAAQAFEQKRQELAASGLTPSADLVSSSQQMQTCLEAARSYARSGDWEGAQDYLTRADGFATRLMRALGR